MITVTNVWKTKAGWYNFLFAEMFEQKNVFLYTQVFKDKQAHKIHLEGNDPKWFFEQMEEIITISRDNGLRELK